LFSYSAFWRNWFEHGSLSQLTAPAASYLKLHIFSNAVEVSTRPGIEYTLHPGRTPATLFEEQKELLSERDKGIYLCASGPFEGAVMDALRRAGIQPKDVRREGFIY